MPMVPDQIIEEIRTRTDIAQVIGDRVPLKRSSGGWVACCPFHHEKTPSFHVNEKRQSFKCFGCGEGGDVFKFLMKHDGMAFMDAVRYLGEKCGVEVVLREDDGHQKRAKRLYQINSEAAAFFRRCLERTPGAAKAREYLESRSLTGEIAERFNLGYDPDCWGTLDEFARRNRFSIQEMIDAGLGTLPENPGPDAKLRDRFHGRLMFPICDHTGRVVAFSARILEKDAKAAKYVNSPETDVFKKARVLYALDKAQRAIAASRHREAILCEGQIDVIRCHACGFDRAVASEGTAFTSEHAKLLHRYADCAVELFDSDNAGRKAAVRTAGILLAEGIPVRVARLPEGEDPDSFLLKNPPEAFQKILDEAIGVIPFHIDYLKAQEADPDGPDAAGRICQGVLQTVASCANAVHKARMIQEVAEGLNLPEDVVRGELQGVEEALRRQAERAESRAAARTAAPPAPAPAPLPSDEPPPEIFDEPDSHAAAPTPVPAAAPKTPAGPDALDLSVCEFLVHHAESEPGTLNALAKYLPVSLFSNDRIRRIVGAFYDSIGASTDPVYDLQAADPAIADFIGTLSVHHDRTGRQENYQAKDVAHNLILLAWSRHLRERNEASLRSTEGDPAERMRTRIENTNRIRALRSWETGAPIVYLLSGAEPEASEAAAPEEPVAEEPAAPYETAPAGDAAAPVSPFTPFSFGAAAPAPVDDPPPPDEPPPDDIPDGL